MRRLWIGPVPLRMQVHEWWSGRCWFYMAAIRVGAALGWVCGGAHARPELAWGCLRHSHTLYRVPRWLARGGWPVEGYEYEWPAGTVSEDAAVPPDGGPAGAGDARAGADAVDALA